MKTKRSRLNERRKGNGEENDMHENTAKKMKYKRKWLAICLKLRRLFSPAKACKVYVSLNLHKN